MCFVHVRPHQCMQKIHACKFQHPGLLAAGECGGSTRVTHFLEFPSRPHGTVRHFGVLAWTIFFERGHFPGGFRGNPDRRVNTPMSACHLRLRLLGSGFEGTPTENCFLGRETWTGYQRMLDFNHLPTWMFVANAG